MGREKIRIKGAAIVGMLILVGIISFVAPSKISEGAYTYEMKAFSSYDELSEYLKNTYQNGTYGGFYYGGARKGAVTLDAGWDAPSNAGESAPDFSTTNVQVAGVDEPDIVKTDGEYLYMVSNEQIYIIRAYPPENATVLSVITGDMRPEHIFINENTLVIFGDSYRSVAVDNNKTIWLDSIPTTMIITYNITDRANPERITSVEMDGSYFDARMIGTMIYVITTEYLGTFYHILDGNDTLYIPEIKIGNETVAVSPADIYYVDTPEPAEAMTHVTAINLENGEILQKAFLIGSTGTLYVSRENIYMTHTKYDYRYGTLEEIYVPPEETTIIHKIAITNWTIAYQGEGRVPGHVLNQFSMDEFNGFFRIATTVGHVWSGTARNNVYILDRNMQVVSSIENIAQGEEIHSARFMGERAYLVTFKKIDPFFTLDLSDPYHPRILGKLKIPGYSDYLHPYDENHIIGIGKETVEALESEKESRNLDFAWYQGIKIALFDVTDFENPVEMTKVVIGDRGTESPVLYDHKALLFDREKELFVIPVSVYEIDEEVKEKYNNATGSMYGEFTFQGVYVYQLTLEDGFVFKGRITHMNVSEENETEYGWRYGDYLREIKRALYIGNTLYTVSESMVKMNSIDTLEEINTIDLE